jgi:hypothetical protein
MTGIDAKQRHDLAQRAEPQAAAARHDGVAVKSDDERPRAHRPLGVELIEQRGDGGGNRHGDVEYHKAAATGQQAGLIAAVFRELRQDIVKDDADRAFDRGRVFVRSEIARGFGNKARTSTLERTPLSITVRNNEMSTALVALPISSSRCYGIDQARRAWLTRDDVINTRSLADLRKLLKR